MDFRGLLEAAGVAVRRESADEYHAPCPRHLQRTGHVDRRPSWSASKTTGNHHCFSCGYGGTLTELLTDLTGAAPPDLEIELHESSFLRRMAEVREAPEKVLDPILTEWALRHVMKDVPRKLMEFRYLKRAALDRYEVRWDTATRRWVLPLRDALGRLVGAQYRQKGVMDTQPAGLTKSTLLFGLQQARPNDYAVVVESPLDAVRLDGLGISALSTLGAWISRDQVTTMARNFTWICLALDDDKAGHEGFEVATGLCRKAGIPALRWDYTGLCDDEGSPAKDVGDVPDDGALHEAWDRTRRFGL